MSHLPIFGHNKHFLRKSKMVTFTCSLMPVIRHNAKKCNKQISRKIYNVDFEPKIVPYTTFKAKLELASLNELRPFYIFIEL